MRNDDDDSEPSTVQVIALSSNTQKELMIPIISKRLTAAQINEAIGERLAWDTFLYTDKYRSYKMFAKQNYIMTIRIAALLWNLQLEVCM